MHLLFINELTNKNKTIKYTKFFWFHHYKKPIVAENSVGNFHLIEGQLPKTQKQKASQPSSRLTGLTGLWISARINIAVATNITIALLSLNKEFVSLEQSNPQYEEKKDYLKHKSIMALYLARLKTNELFNLKLIK